MYDWLRDLPDDRSFHVVTPNRRLARTLREAHAAKQTAAGASAWRTPPIFGLQDWYHVLAENAAGMAGFPVRINEQQARLVWEDCLRPAIDDPFVNIGALTRLCRDAWQRLRDWQVPLERLSETATGPDQHLFARAATRFETMLRDRAYADAATLPALLEAAIAAGALQCPVGVLYCGFDRLPPQFMALLATMEARGTHARAIPGGHAGAVRLLAYPDPDAELRAAGAWARAELERDPQQSIAIVVTRLEQDAERSAGLIREGLLPGWQAAPARVTAAVDLSIGRRLAELPAIHAALLCLRWCEQPLGAAEIGMLLRSPFVGNAETAGRSRLELQLREWPDREWRLEVLLEALSGRDESPDAADWLACFRRARELAAEGAAAKSTARWAEQFDRILDSLRWPGEKPLDSTDFQLDNRWRKLLNEFSRLDLVAAPMRGREAVARLAALAADTVYQPESDGAVLTILGPLEAAGLEFDRLRVTGAIATEWPPAGRPLPLIARDLQREYRMPDATPEDTVAFARRVLRRIAGAAGVCTLTYPRMVGDTAQVPTRLLGPLEAEREMDEPGWFAAAYAGDGHTHTLIDPAPALRPGERVAGGATTIQQQREEPFTAFACGRLRVRNLRSFARGIPANLRGNLVHAALANLYGDKPDQLAIRNWTAAQRAERIAAAVDRAYMRVERFADAALRQMFLLERRRTLALLDAVVDYDLERDAFAVAEVESRFDTGLGRVPLRLRCDRIDRLADGSLAIIDYKTGQAKKFAGSGGPHDLQLVVYACAVTESIGGLGLFNVDSRRLGIDGAGPAFGKHEDWDAKLTAWQADARRHASDLANGDVRLNVLQGLADARALSVLSRYPEVYRGD